MRRAPSRPARAPTHGLVVAPVMALLLVAMALLLVAIGPIQRAGAQGTETSTTEQTNTTTTTATTATTGQTVATTEPTSTTAATTAETTTTTTVTSSTGEGDDPTTETSETTTTGDRDSATASLDEAIQILAVDESGDGQLTIQLAIPSSIGELVPAPANFGVLDGGQLVEFAVNQITTAVDVVIVLDTSGSMASSSALDEAKRAATAFIEDLPEGTRVGLISFGDEVTVHRDLDRERQSLLDQVEGLVAEGETVLWDGMTAAAQMVEDSDEPFVVVLSDGEDTESTATRSEVIDRLDEAGAHLYAVAIEGSETDFAALQDTVAQVGGQYIDTPDVTELVELYADIAGRLGNRYELRYQSNRETARTITISVAVDGALAVAKVDIGQEAVAGAPAAPSTVADDEPSRSVAVPADERLGLVSPPSLGLLGTSGLWIGAALFFLALTGGGLALAAPGANPRPVRLDRAVSADRVAGLKERAGLAVDRLLSRRNRDASVDRALDAAGIDLRPGEFLLLAAVAVAAFGLLLSALGGLAAGVLGIVLGTVAVTAYLRIRADRRRARFAEQLVDTLAIISGGLRAGRGLPQAIDLVAQEAPSPTKEQFQRVVFEVRVGRDLTDSVTDVARRMRSKDLGWVAQAVDISRELGGDLTELLDNVADTIRDRRRVTRQIHSLTAEGRATAWVLQGMPVLLFLLMLWRTPDNAALLLNDPFGRLLTGIAVIGMVVGAIWIRRLINIKY